MRIKTLYGLYFSVSHHTRRYIEGMLVGLPYEKVTIDITDTEERALHRTFDADDLVIVAGPVYGGRLPIDDFLGNISGNNTPAIIAVTYGVRAYEDALIELADALTAKGFVVIGAAALVAEHTTVPQIATGRPLDSDISAAARFVKNCIAKETFSTPVIPGNRPYKARTASTFAPVLSGTCFHCGVCQGLCPVGAISLEDEAVVDIEKCILCTACIQNCVTKARIITEKSWHDKRDYLLKNFAHIQRENEFYI